MFKIEWKIGNFFNTKNKHQMKHAKFSAILGRDVKVGEVLSEADLTKISQALGETENDSQDAGANGEENPEGSTSTEQNSTQKPAPETADLSATISAAVQSAMAPIQNQLTEMSTRLKVVEGSAGADKTGNPVVTGDAKTMHSWEDPNSPINQKIAADLG
jgi:hypothetical protein